MDFQKYGPWALIVGGSEGIGASFARKLAAGGLHLVLVARKPEPLAELQQELTRTGVEVRAISVDLSKADALDRVREVTDDIEVGFLIYNAGANSIRGNILELDPEVYRAIIQINVLGQVEFTRHYGGMMRERGRGAIILTGSSSNFLGAKTLGPYTASKAFSRIFSETLWAESQEMGIDVLHMVINYTDTPAMRRLGLDTTSAQSPDDVAQEALDNLTNGPLLILGGEKALEVAQMRSTLVNRGQLINSIATPKREEIAHLNP
jgi:short-subunit dehydrogenase